MNERILELAEQAGYKPLPGFDFANSLEETYLKKFAELIVRECIETINDRVLNSDGSGDWYTGYVAGATECRRKIKEHFGVEE